jgi:hypothetical protein
MLPESLNWPIDPFLVGAVVLAIGCLVAASGATIKSRNAERDLDQRYVRQKRGEALPPTEVPKIVGVLVYLGGGIGALGIVILVLAWTLLPGQS